MKRGGQAMASFLPVPAKSPTPDCTNHRIAWSRRAILGGLGAPLLAGCSSDSNSDANMFGKMAAQSIAVFGAKPSITLDQVASIPYATIGVRLGDGPQTLLVLATRTGDSFFWTSA